MPLEMRKELDALAKHLADSGRLIEAGWVALRLQAIPHDAPEIQIQEMRNAYMAGAQHLFASMMATLDSGDEPTDADMRRMDLISAELDAFYREAMARAK
jgi:hypothetical protein